jgi:streptogramin lyase
MTLTEKLRASMRPSSVAAIAVLAGVAVGLALAPRAEAFIYWTDGSAGTIGRANPDGGGVNQQFIAGAAEFPAGVAAGADHLYWANFAAGTIGRARLDGTHAKLDFIPGCGCDPSGVAVDQSHIYWTNFGGSLSRANLDGSGIEAEFVPLPFDSHPFGVAVDDGHVYWTRSFGNTIDRANLDGSGVELGLIDLNPYGADYVAVSDTHLYWTNNIIDTIGRANLDGSGVDQQFIVLSPESHPYGIAVNGSHVYWTDIGATAIGRAGLDGSDLEPQFVDLPIGGLPYGLAVDSGSDTRLRGGADAKRVQVQRGQRIRVKVTLKAGEPLRASIRSVIELGGNSYNLTPLNTELAPGARRSVKLQPRRRQAQRRLAHSLADGRSARAEIDVKLTDGASNTESERLEVRLKG